MYDLNSVASFQNVFLNRSMNGIRMYDRYLITGATGFSAELYLRNWLPVASRFGRWFYPTTRMRSSFQRGFNASPAMFSIKNRLRPF